MNIVGVFLRYLQINMKYYEIILIQYMMIAEYLIYLFCTIVFTYLKTDSDFLSRFASQ